MIKLLEWLFNKHIHQWSYTYERDIGSEVTYIRRHCTCGRIDEKATSAYGDLYTWSRQ